jgi:hypothetical protein
VQQAAWSDAVQATAGVVTNNPLNDLRQEAARFLRGWAASQGDDIVLRWRETDLSLLCLGAPPTLQRLRQQLAQSVAAEPFKSKAPDIPAERDAACASPAEAT